VNPTTEGAGAGAAAAAMSERGRSRRSEVSDPRSQRSRSGLRSEVSEEPIRLVAVPMGIDAEWNLRQGWGINAAYQLEALGYTWFRRHLVTASVAAHW
jgi:hypothetical protein